MKKLITLSIIAGLIPNIINIISGLIYFKPWGDILLFVFFLILILLTPITFVTGIIAAKRRNIVQWNQQIKLFIPLGVVAFSLVLLVLTSFIGHYIRYESFENNKAEYIEVYDLLKNNKINDIGPTGYVNLPNKYCKLQGRIFFYRNNNKVEARVVLTGGFPMMYSRFIFRDTTSNVDLLLDQSSWWAFGDMP
jgi:hypothetical protein